MQEFSRQPSVALADTYPYEVKLMAYYGTALRTLTGGWHDAQNLGTRFSEIASQQSRLVPNPWNLPLLHRAIGGSHLERLFRDTVPDRMAEVFRGIFSIFIEQLLSHATSRLLPTWPKNRCYMARYGTIFAL